MGYNRKDPRFSTNLVALVRRTGFFDWKAAAVVNLSAGGVCIKTEAELYEGDLVELEINTVDKDDQPRKRRVRGEVMWSGRREYGIKFANNGKDGKDVKKGSEG